SAALIPPASSSMNETALSGAQLQLKLLQQPGLKQTSSTQSIPVLRFVPPPTGGSRPLVGSAAAGESQVMSPSTGLRSIFVSYLPRSLSSADLLHLFTPFGKVISAIVQIDKDTGIHRGFGFVSYDNSNSADAAISAMN
ncbi:hypothetical protein PMAYCL1PPCAC_01582, partial [Pristionchus mayeri]